MRIYRCFASIEYKAKGGGYHEPELCDMPGGLALFCTSCPQPGINVGQRQPGDEDWMYNTNWVLDGNFKMEQMKMRNPGQDVRLRPGTGFMVEDKGYQSFLKQTAQVV